jgi:hypothetical protein
LIKPFAHARKLPNMGYKHLRTEKAKFPCEKTDVKTQYEKSAEKTRRSSHRHHDPNAHVAHSNSRAIDVPRCVKSSISTITTTTHVSLSQPSKSPSSSSSSRCNQAG